MIFKKTRGPAVDLATRQVERRAIRLRIEDKLRSTDFEGEPVAVRSADGRAIIRRPEKWRFKSMVRALVKRTWQARVKERAALVAQRERERGLTLRLG